MGKLSIKNNDSGRLPELDGIRGLAILMVIVWHYGNCQLASQSLTLNPVLKALTNATSLFWSGVDLFFVLSGFLIGGILLKYKNSSSSYFRAFYTRRIFRIFPIYYMLFALTLVCTLLGVGLKFPWLFNRMLPLWSFPLFIQNFFMAQYSTYGAHWLGVTWSLAIEEQFYLIIPAVIYFTKRERLPIILSFFIVLAPLFRILFNRLGFSDLYSEVLLPCRMDSLLLGVLIAYCFQNKDFIASLQNRKIFIYLAFWVLLIGLLIMQSVGKFTGFRFTLLAFLYGTLIIIALIDKESLLGKFLRNPILQQAGIVSYGIYLYHQPISGIMHQLFLKQSPQIIGLNSLLVTLLALITTIIAALISYYLFERFLINIGHKSKY
ncbi:MAG: acyltransferase [Candidatus Omnitrophica bacterium]|nr:acyltransferase [Candidatus Omnitrophota bacterium]MBU1870170.1 acyltransferase [Candidatus Omnitrophota bacterium]